MKNTIVKLGLTSLFGGLALSYSALTLSHSEHDKARFVANQGQDTGRCDNVIRPCKTIAYAVSQAGKGDRVLIAGGNYHIESSDELFYLKSLLVPIYGGYNRFDHFQSQSPDSNQTVLTGVPLSMADELRAKGFTVISDGKAIDNSTTEQADQLAKKLSGFQVLAKAQQNQPCENGKAGEFDCNNIDLLAHMPLNAFSSRPSSANDIWGHTDLNTGKEYALIGLRNGVAVVDVSTPSAPQEVGTISGVNSTWRDIKVYQHFDTSLNIWRAYAYVTTDSVDNVNNRSDDVTIIDLNHLPDSVSLIERNNSVRTAHNVYITNVDYSLNVALANLTPSLQLTGANRHSGAFHNYSLANPRTIAPFANQSTGNGYSHDGASVVISDDRKTNDCQQQEDCIVFIDFNEQDMKLWNISDPSQVSLLGTGEYNDVAKSAQYVHSGWATEDGNYVFLHDEFDEQRASLNSTVRVFDINDLNTPNHIGQWTGPTRAIDHNGFVRGNRYYLSNYERGLSVLDITDPTAPAQIGFFDTYTPSDNASFNGAWGVYPFLPSGNILVSDINSGLYVLKDNTLNSPQGKLSFSAASVNASQGESITINVMRSNANAANIEPVTVGYQLIPGSAIENEDYTPTQGTLSWLANDSNNKSFTLDIAAASSSEELEETFFVRLFNPTNGANLTTPSYLTVNIAGRPNTGIISFTETTRTVAENVTDLTVTVSRSGSSQGEVRASYTVVAGTATIPDDVAAASGQLTWQDGDTNSQSINITIVDDNLEESSETFSIQLASVDNSVIGDNSQITVTISDNDRNTAPVIGTIEDFQVNTNQTVTLTANISDPEGDPVTLNWQQTAGTNVDINNANSATLNFVAPDSAATLTFQLTATDNKNASSTESVTITVVAPPAPAPTPTPAPAPTPAPTNNDSGGGSTSWLLALLVVALFRAQKANRSGVKLG